MILFFSRFFCILLASSFAYPNLRLDQLVANWTVSGTTSYALCRSGRFDDLKYGEYFLEYRGACLLTQISAVMHNLEGNKAVRASSYTSTGTGYSQFEIVEGGPTGFCVRRLGTECQG